MEWDFDIFRLEELSEKRPLLHLGMELFRRFDVFSTLNIDETTCKSWFIVMEAHYHSTNTYHNSTHAADVMQVSANKQDALLAELTKIRYIFFPIVH